MLRILRRPSRGSDSSAARRAAINGILDPGFDLGEGSWLPHMQTASRLPMKPAAIRSIHRYC
ncbi:conserved hypothetical protein [Ricinus communis]|uniref:Uncharacterized protein n=1 Tax=Ricinus communis TaxID=3988 RepID=B9TM57_RICCO|nr:conserved hypothetical protein [Ricinus communis]